MSRSTADLQVKIALHFGALAPPIRLQLLNHHPTLEWKRRRLGTYQRLADAITLLALQSMATDRMVHNMRTKLINTIAREARSRL